MLASFSLGVADGFPAYDDSTEKYHDAAYDAYVTGKCFSIMANWLGKKAEPPVTDILINHKLLSPFLNK